MASRSTDTETSGGTGGNLAREGRRPERPETAQQATGNRKRETGSTDPPDAAQPRIRRFPFPVSVSRRLLGCFRPLRAPPQNGLPQLAWYCPPMPAPSPIRYHVAMPEPASHELHVTMEVPPLPERASVD